MGNETQQTTKNTKKTEAPPPAAQQTAMVPPPATQAMEVFDYGDDAGQGWENQDMSDRKLPMLQLLQSNSPQVVESKGKVPIGGFLNTVTGEVYEECYLVPAITDHCFTLWIPRDEGGGFRGRFPKDAKLVLDAIARNDGRSIGKLPVPMPPHAKTGKPQPVHELVETFEVYGILCNKAGEVLGFCVIPFTSTKIKVYRAWNSQLTQFSPTINGKKIPPGKIPLFAHFVKLSSTSDTNAQGTFMIPTLEPAMGGDDLKNSLLPKTDLRYLAAKQLHDDVLKGLAKGDYETMTPEPSADPEGGVPF